MFVSSRCEELCLEIDEALWHWLRVVVPKGHCHTVLIFTVSYGAYNAADPIPPDRTWFFWKEFEYLYAS